jgi:hypothetical protein
MIKFNNYRRLENLYLYTINMFTDKFRALTSYRITYLRKYYKN